MLDPNVSSYRNNTVESSKLIVSTVWYTLDILEEVLAICLEMPTLHCSAH